jgi:phosphoglycerol transferase MdoB-like AlkP superfamily enzyme
MFRLAGSRSIITIAFLSFLIAGFVTRSVLLAWGWAAADLDPAAVMEIYAVGFVYDLALALYATLPLALYVGLMPSRWWFSRLNRVAMHVFFVLAFALLIFTFCAELLFWDEFSVRFNFIAVDYLVYTHEVIRNIVESYPIAWLLIALFLGSLAIWAMLRRVIAKAIDARPLFSRRLVSLSIHGLAVAIAVFGLDQRLHDLGPNTYRNELAASGPYQLFAAFRNNELDYKRNFASLPDAEVAAELRHILGHPGETFLDEKEPVDIIRHVPHAHPAHRMNVVLVTVESLSAGFLGYFGNGDSLTPELDALIDESLFFENFYATGTRTVRGLEAVTLSLPPTPGRAIVKRLGRETGLWSLGGVLRDQGYDVEFLYGGYGYFDNMNAFFAGNGYDVYDRMDVPSEKVGFENAWGMADEYLFNLALDRGDQATEAGRPFFLHIMTTSNHRPYTYPEGRIDVPSGTGRAGAVKYADWAIGDFLRHARDKPWFDDTLFVILADHQASSAGRVQVPAQRYLIPMWFYSPGNIKPDIVSTLSSQIDVAPTLLSLLGFEYDSSAFGQDILATSPGSGRALFGNYQNLALFDGKDIAVLGPRKEEIIRHDPLGPSPLDESATSDNPLVHRAIVYYQGAAEFYDKGLDVWPAMRVSRNDPES